MSTLDRTCLRLGADFGEREANVAMMTNTTDFGETKRLCDKEEGKGGERGLYTRQK
jgi:hypothetical protein